MAGSQAGNGNTIVESHRHDAKALNGEDAPPELESVQGRFFLTGPKVQGKAWCSIGGFRFEAVYWM